MKLIRPLIPFSGYGKLRCNRVVAQVFTTSARAGGKVRYPVYCGQPVKHDGDLCGGCIRDRIREDKAARRLRRENP